MSHQPYDYENRVDIYPVSWEAFHGICRALAIAVSRFQPELVLAVGRGGYYPGTLVSHMLQVEIYPVRLSRRVNDIVRYQNPRWLVEPPSLVGGRRVLVVDEICSSGQTLSVVKERLASMGAAESRSAVLYAHSWSVTVPDYIGVITDALVLNPWDREIVRNGVFEFHPEYVEALAHHNIEAGSSLLINAPHFTLAKGQER